MVDEYNKIVESHRKNVEQHNSMAATYNRASDDAQRRRLESKLRELKAKVDEQVSQLDALKSRIEKEGDPRIIEVADLTNAMQSLDKTLSEFNPAVYASYQRLAQFASFFRYVKQSNPSNWRAFQRTIRAIAVAPSVLTPTAWERDAR